MKDPVCGMEMGEKGEKTSGRVQGKTIIERPATYAITSHER